MVPLQQSLRLGRARVVFYSTKNLFPLNRTKPIESSAKTLRHIQFTNRIPFEDGLKIQEKFVRANLDMKVLQSKIKTKLTKLQEEHVDATINENEKMIIDNILSMKPNPLVLTFEFEPTYTGGKRIKKSITESQIKAFENFVPKHQINNIKPKFVQVERGGEITFHGPGQMVAYVILDLKSFKDFPAKCLISCMETATINCLKNLKIDESSQLNLEAKLTEKTGVWTVNNKKIASLGIHVRRSITSHGVCINVTPDLSYLNSFEMCGTSDHAATSIGNERPGIQISVQDVAISFVRELAKLLGIETVERIQSDGSDILKE